MIGYAVNGCTVVAQPHQLLLVVDNEVVAIDNRRSRSVCILVDNQLILLAAERSQGIFGTLLEGNLLELANDTGLYSRSTRGVELYGHLLAVSQTQYCNAESEFATRKHHEELLRLGSRELQALTERVVQSVRCALQSGELTIRKVNIESTCDSTDLGCYSHTCKGCCIIRALNGKSQHTTQVIQLYTLANIGYLAIHRGCSALESTLFIVLLRCKHHIRAVSAHACR